MRNCTFQENHDYLRKSGLTAQSIFERGHMYIKLKLKQLNKRQKNYKETIIGYIRANKNKILRPRLCCRWSTRRKWQLKTSV